jgi:hypothetical protein
MNGNAISADTTVAGEPAAVSSGTNWADIFREVSEIGLEWWQTVRPPSTLPPSAYNTAPYYGPPYVPPDQPTRAPVSPTVLLLAAAVALVAWSR